MKYYFQQFAVLPFDIVVCADSASDAHNAVSEKTLVSCSPSEILFAYIVAVHRALDSNDDDLLAQWKGTMLACPIKFVQQTKGMRI